MVRRMLDELASFEEISTDINYNDGNLSYLLDGGGCLRVPQNYVPMMKRERCASVETLAEKRILLMKKDQS
jgi:hypothetical protein